MKRTIILIVIVCITLLLVIGCASSQRAEDHVLERNVETLGVWWWAHTDLDGPYFDFAVKNGINEIFLSTNVFNQRVSDFIARASEHGVKVYWLQGDWSWIHNDTHFRNRYVQYLAFNEAQPENRRFAGIHLNVEPHQDPEWRANPTVMRPILIQKLVDFALKLRDDFPDEHFDHAITFWLNDAVNYKGQQIPANHAMMMISNRVFLMTYRDSAERIFNLGTVPQQIEFARSLGKTIFLCAESSYPPEQGTEVSFRNQGRRFMHEEILKLKDMANYDKLGIAIHHMRTWFDLKDQL